MILNRYSTRILLIISILYGLLSTSSPDKITLVEVIIGLSLLFIVGTEGIRELAASKKNFQKNYLFIPYIIKISFLYLLFIPTLIGLVFMDNTVKNWIRDLIPLLYLFLPILIVKKLNDYPKEFFLTIIISLCIIGFLFSIRFYVGATGGISDIGSIHIIGINRDNNMQDPAVTFLLSFTSCLALWLLLSRKIILGIIFLLVSFLPWSVMFASIIRGPVFFTAMSLFLLFIYWIFFQKKKFGGILLIFLLIIITINFYNGLFDILANSIDLLIKKQKNVGISYRTLEFSLVIKNLNLNIFNFLFGYGWGSLIEIPTVGLSRNLHNIFLYFLFKCGFIGFIFFSFFFLWLIKFIFFIKFENRLIFIVFISLVCPLIYSLFFQPVYKSLSFGILILLLPLISKLIEFKEFNKFLDNKIS